MVADAEEMVEAADADAMINQEEIDVLVEDAVTPDLETEVTDVLLTEDLEDAVILEVVKDDLAKVLVTEVKDEVLEAIQDHQDDRKARHQLLIGQDDLDAEIKLPLS